MKTAIAQIDAVSIWCPYCGEVFSDTPSGSTLVSCADGLRARQVVTCQSCGARSRLPVIVERLERRWMATPANAEGMSDDEYSDGLKDAASL